MVSKRVMRAMVLVVLLTAWTGMAVWADVITLENGEVFPDLQVKSYEGKTRQFDVQSHGKSVQIAASEVADIRFDPRTVTLSLTDGESVYSSIEVQQFDGARGRFSIHRGAKVVEINAAEVASIDFTPKAVGVAGSTIQAASTVVDQPGMLPPVLRPIQVVAPPAVSTESNETTLVKKESVAVPSVPPSPSPVAEEKPLPPPPSSFTAEETGESLADGAASDGWDDDSLYGPLGDNFGQPKTVVPGQTDSGYMARWKGSGAASGDSIKGEKKSEAGSAKKKTSSSSSSKSKGGRSSKSKGDGGSDKEMSDKDDKSSSKSSRRSRSRGDDDSDSRNSNRNSSRYGSDSYGSSSSSSRYGSSSGRYGSSNSYGGYGSSSSNYNSGSRYSNY